MLIVSSIILLFTACESGNDNSEVYFTKGLENIRYGDYNEALTQFDKVLKIEPNNFQAYYHRGNCYMNLRQYKVAIDEYNEAIKINESYADAISNKGQAYFYLKDYVNACKYFQKAHDLGKPNMEDKLRHCN